MTSFTSTHPSPLLGLEGPCFPYPQLHHESPSIPLGRHSLAGQGECWPCTAPPRRGWTSSPWTSLLLPTRGRRGQLAALHHAASRVTRTCPWRHSPLQTQKESTGPHLQGRVSSHCQSAQEWPESPGDPACSKALSPSGCKGPGLLPCSGPSPGSRPICECQGLVSCTQFPCCRPNLSTSDVTALGTGPLKSGLQLIKVTGVA